MKYLLVLLVVGIGLWSLLSRLRGNADAPARRGKPQQPRPVVMVECARCGLHLPAADAVPEGSRLYCCEAHRRQGPAPTPPR